MRRNLATRVRRLGERCRPRGGIHWDNLLAEKPEDVVPDGVVDWHGLLFGDTADGVEVGPGPDRREHRPRDRRRESAGGEPASAADRFG